MPKTDEKLIDIVAEMRGNEFDDPHLDADGIIGARRLARDWADRIEAAAERERDEDRQLAAIAESDEAFARCARCDRPERAPGNAAALREALEGCMHEMCERCDSYMADNMQTHKPCPGCVIVDKARAALSAPARNCDRFADVLRANEACATLAQAKRHMKQLKDADDAYDIPRPDGYYKLVEREVTPWRIVKEETK